MRLSCPKEAVRLTSLAIRAESAAVHFSSRCQDKCVILPTFYLQDKQWRDIKYNKFETKEKSISLKSGKGKQLFPKSASISISKLVGYCESLKNNWCEISKSIFTNSLSSIYIYQNITCKVSATLIIHTTKITLKSYIW